MQWHQHRVLSGAVSPGVVVDLDSILNDLSPEVRPALQGFIDEYAGFIMRERTWQRKWSAEPGVEVELSFLNEDMKAAVGGWTAEGRLYQMAILLPGIDKEVEAGLITKLSPSLSDWLAGDIPEELPSPALLVIPMAEAPESIRGVLQTDLLTLPAAFFRLASEAAELLRNLE